MLNSEEWTREMFVCEPKERVLSAHLHKFVLVPRFLNRECCSTLSNENDKEECSNKLKEEGGNFGYFLNAASNDCENQNGDPQEERTDSKWWNC